MASRGRPTVSIELTADEGDTLQRWARRHSSSQALALRARIVLACDEGLSHQAVAAREGCNPVTVSKWRRRFAEDRLVGLVDAPRPGTRRTVSDDVIEQVVVDTLEGQPNDATHWSTRGLAAKHGISKTTLAEIWRAFGLKPWRENSFKVSPDPDLLDKIRDLVGLYLNPPEAAAVFAIDEKPQIQALDRTAPRCRCCPPPRPGPPTTPSATATVDLFAALDIARGTVSSVIRKSHNQHDCIAFLNQINREVPNELDVHIVLDNLSTHKTPKVQRWLLRHRRFHLHFTPTYGSWLNLVERWFSALTTKKLQRSAHTSATALAADITTWVEVWNADPKPFMWTKTAEDILDRLAGYCRAVTLGAWPHNHTTCQHNRFTRKGH